MSNPKRSIEHNVQSEHDLSSHHADRSADFDHELYMYDPPRPSRKRVTGIHPDIRTTQIDESGILPPPQFDEPEEDVPREQENESGDRPEEIIEDAYDE
ncbi:MAG: hypothetical protein CUN55_14030 [Phototrophicales bacterium]|nr:MAG: hypothetical protein CUN55_14030 [Phototrophicales bacterium]